MLKTLGCNAHTVAVRYFIKNGRLLLNVLNQNKTFMKKAEFIFSFDSEDKAKIVAESLNPEIKHKIPKTNVEIFLKGKTFTLKIEAKDISSLRAACNSYLRWVNVASSVEKTV